MRDWKPLRDSQYEDYFCLKLAALEIAQEDFDDVAPLIDDALCGAAVDRLNEVFPTRVGGLRLYLTEATIRVPGLRIAFRLEAYGTITYVDVDIR